MGNIFQNSARRSARAGSDGADLTVGSDSDTSTDLAAAAVGDALDRLERLARGGSSDIAVRPADEPILPEQSDDDLLQIARDPIKLRETCIVSLLKAANRAETMTQRIQALKAAADLGAVAENTRYRVAHVKDGMTVNVLSVQGALMKAKELTLESSRQPALPSVAEPVVPEPPTDLGAPSVYQPN